MCNNSVPAGQKCIFCCHVSRGVSYSVSAPTSQIWNWFFFRGFFCFSILVKFPSNFFCLEMISTHKLPSRADLLLRLFEHICLKRSAFRRIPSILIGGGGDATWTLQKRDTNKYKKIHAISFRTKCTQTQNAHNPTCFFLCLFAFFVSFVSHLWRVYMSKQPKTDFVCKPSSLLCCLSCGFLFVCLFVCLPVYLLIHFFSIFLLFFEYFHGGVYVYLLC